MIEFCPNASGPAHLGTLRTYSVAWRRARKLHEPLLGLFQCFPHNPHASDSWAEQFLQELDALDLRPDFVEYFRELAVLPAVPKWARIVDGRAYFPAYERCYVPSNLPWEWKGPDPPMVPYPDNPIGSPFATIQEDGRWVIKPPLTVNAWRAFAGVTCVARSMISTFIAPAYDQPTAQCFGIRSPEVVLTGVVVHESGALSKSRLKPRSAGTVQWAIDKYGTEHVRSSVLHSAACDDRKVIPYAEVLQHEM